MEGREREQRGRREEGEEALARLNFGEFSYVKRRRKRIEGGGPIKRRLT